MLAGDLSDVDEANGGKAADVTFVVFTAAKVALAANTAVNVDDTSSPSMPASRIRVKKSLHDPYLCLGAGNECVDVTSCPFRSLKVFETVKYSPGTPGRGMMSRLR